MLKGEEKKYVVGKILQHPKKAGEDKKYTMMKRCLLKD